MQTVGDRLREARIAAGYETAKAAADAFGWHPQNVRDQEADRRGVSAEQAKTYARAYRVEPTWILYGGPNPKAKVAPSTVKIWGLVGANPEGRVLFSSGQDTGDAVLLSGGGSTDVIALEVKGHSMAGFADDGALIFFRERHSSLPKSFLGKVVVCQTRTGEVLVKRLLKGSRPGVYDLESIVGPTMEDVEIEWAALVTQIILPDEARRLIVRNGEAAA